MEWVCKCADVVMESREAERARGGGEGAMKANVVLFSLGLVQRRETTRVVTERDEDGKGAEDGSFGRGGRFRERVVVLDVFLEREMSSKDGDEGRRNSAGRWRALDRRRANARRRRRAGVIGNWSSGGCSTRARMGRAWVGIITSTRI